MSAVRAHPFAVSGWCRYSIGTDFICGRRGSASGDSLLPCWHALGCWGAAGVLLLLQVVALLGCWGVAASRGGVGWGKGGDIV